MDGCGHYSIRGDVFKHREREPRMNYPLTLPEGLTEEQIRSLLPLMASRKCRRWDCQLCVKEFTEQDCPHDQQLAIEAGPSVAALDLDNAAVVTKTNRSILEKIDAVEVLICTEGSVNAEVECTMKKQKYEPKVFFDLNIPIDELCDEALENSNNHAPATEELAVAHNIPERSIADVVSVDEQQTISLGALEPQASAEVPNNGIGDSNVSPPPEILVHGGNKISSIKKACKYHSMSYLNEERKREESQNVPHSNLQSNKTEWKNKRKMQQQSRTAQEGPAGTKIFKATEDVSEQNRQNRTIDCNLPLKQNYTMGNASPRPRRESSGKRKSLVNNDRNGNSDAVISNSSEESLQNKSRSFDLQLKKRRISLTFKKTPLADADQSQAADTDGSKRIEPDAEQSQQVEQAADQSQRVESVGHKSKKNAPSSSVKKESLIAPFADLGNSRPTGIMKATSKVACQLMIGKNKNRGEPISTACDKESPEKSSPVVVGKEFVLQDKPISTVARDVPMPCLQDDNFNLKQLQSEIIKTLKRHKFDSPSADNSQNVIPTSENEKLGGKGDTDLTLGAPQEKKKEIEKSNLKEVKRRGRPKKLPTSGASRSGTKKKGGNDVLDTTGKEEPVVMDITATRPILPSEAALQLLSMVAVGTLENQALSDSGLYRTFLPTMEEFHVHPIRNVLEMGYEGCIEVTNPADYFLVDGDGDRFKLVLEDLPLRPHRLLPAKSILPVAYPTIAATRVAVPAE